MTHPLQDKFRRQAPAPGRDDTIDDELEKERLQPGLDAQGEGEAGSGPSNPRSDGNSNT